MIFEAPKNRPNRSEEGINMALGALENYLGKQMQGEQNVTLAKMFGLNDEDAQQFYGLDPQGAMFGINNAIRKQDLDRQQNYNAAAVKNLSDFTGQDLTGMDANHALAYGKLFVENQKNNARMSSGTGGVGGPGNDKKTETPSQSDYAKNLHRKAGEASSILSLADTAKNLIYSGGSDYWSNINNSAIQDQANVVYDQINNALGLDRSSGLSTTKKPANNDKILDQYLKQIKTDVFNSEVYNELVSGGVRETAIPHIIDQVQGNPEMYAQLRSNLGLPVGQQSAPQATQQTQQQQENINQQQVNATPQQQRAANTNLIPEGKMPRVVLGKTPMVSPDGKAVYVPNDQVSMYYTKYGYKELSK